MTDDDDNKFLEELCIKRDGLILPNEVSKAPASEDAGIEQIDVETVDGNVLLSFPDFHQLVKCNHSLKKESDGYRREFETAAAERDQLLLYRRAFWFVVGIVALVNVTGAIEWIRK